MPLSASSVAHAHTVLAGILDDAVCDRRLATNPARGVKLPRKITKARNYLTAVQVSALAQEAKHPDIVSCWPQPGCGGVRWPRFVSATLTSVVAASVWSAQHRR